MDASRLELAKTELDFLQRLLLELQRKLAMRVPGDEAELVAALELALAMLRWNGETPPGFDLQLGLGAAVERRYGLDAMCAYRQWRNERRRATQALTP